MTTTKLVLIGLAIAAAIGSQFVTGEVHTLLFGMATWLAGLVMRAPGDQPAAPSKRPSVPPVAILFAVLLVFGTGCPFWQTVKPIIKTIADVALAQCHVSARANPKMLGPMTAEEWCDQADNFAPFLEAQRLASASAGGELGLTAAPPLVGEAE